MINTGKLGFVERKKGHCLSKLKGFNAVFFFIKEASYCNRQRPLQKTDHYRKPQAINKQSCEVQSQWTHLQKLPHSGIIIEEETKRCRSQGIKEFDVRLCLLEATPIESHQYEFTYEMNKEDTNRHVKVDGEEPRGPQICTKNFRQLRNTES